MLINNSGKYFSKTLTWMKTEHAEFPFSTWVNGECWEIRINDFPEEPLYTLLIEKNPVIHFDDWPKRWKKT